MKVGCYGLDLYCDAFGEYGHRYGMAGGKEIYQFNINSEWVDGFGQFSGRTEAVCLRRARKAGWKISRKGVVMCPLCLKRKKGKSDGT